jgi:gamma-glutamyl:cysteine ligase YbdK (ATP-grasp superfamily)
MARAKVLSLFEAYGIELEYMIVNQDTLAPLPICDRVLFDLAHEKTMEIPMGEVAWSNELALHIIELKANGPKKSLSGLHREFVAAVERMNVFLQNNYNAVLMPTGMHPFFSPEKDGLKLWPDENALIYKTYDRIFGCKGHGWGNVQATHLNLPFNGDDEFGRLHSAIRLILPLLPALAASSPLVEGKAGPVQDSRLHYYLANQRKIAAIIGDGIPEAVSTKREYEERILTPMYQAIAPFDPEGTLAHEWLNSRAAIARFERNAIEIRILDLQECVAGDMALISAIIGALKKLCLAPGADLSAQLAISQQSLVATLHGALHQGLDFVVPDTAYLKALGTRGRSIREIMAGWVPEDPVFSETYTEMLARGSVAGEIMRRCGPSPSRGDIVGTYRQLIACLGEDSLLVG